MSDEFQPPEVRNHLGGFLLPTHEHTHACCLARVRFLFLICSSAYAYLFRLTTSYFKSPRLSTPQPDRLEQIRAFLLERGCSGRFSQKYLVRIRAQLLTGARDLLNSGRDDRNQNSIYLEKGGFKVSRMTFVLTNSDKRHYVSPCLISYYVGIQPTPTRQADGTNLKNRISNKPPDGNSTNAE